MPLRRLFLLTTLAVLGLAAGAYAQSQAINGTIEGVIRDTSGALLPSVTVTLTNSDTGSQRVVTTGAK